MEDLLIEILESFGYPVMLQGSMSADEKYPNHFFTFWNNSSYDGSYYDNEEHSTVYNYSINFYSIDPALVYTKLLNSQKRLREAKTELKKRGFIVSGDGHSVDSDEPTHDGRGIEAIFIRR